MGWTAYVKYTADQEIKARKKDVKLTNAYIKRINQKDPDKSGWDVNDEYTRREGIFKHDMKDWTESRIIDYYYDIGSREQRILDEEARIDGNKKYSNHINSVINWQRRKDAGLIKPKDDILNLMKMRKK